MGGGLYSSMFIGVSNVPVDNMRSSKLLHKDERRITSNVVIGSSRPGSVTEANVSSTSGNMTGRTLKNSIGTEQQKRTLDYVIEFTAAAYWNTYNCDKYKNKCIIKCNAALTTSFWANVSGIQKATFWNHHFCRETLWRKNDWRQVLVYHKATEYKISLTNNKNIHSGAMTTWAVGSNWNPSQNDQDSCGTFRW
jgi:hypothetical protein